MIKELIPLLTTHRLDLRLDVKDEHIHIYILPTVKNDKLDTNEKQVLEQNLVRKYAIGEFSNEKFVEEIHSYSNALIEGTTDIEAIKENIKKVVSDKKASAKPKPKRKTAAQKKQELEAEREAAREKQAKERKGQAALPLEDENRLGEKVEPKPRTPADKAMERVNRKEEEKPKEEEKQEPVSTAVESESKVDDDPFGLNDL